MRPTSRRFLRAVLLALLVTPLIAAICVPSGAWEVAATPDGSLIIFDSARNLARSDDSGATWYVTDSLPLQSTRMTSEACVTDGRCFRIRADGLAVEESSDGGWRTAWEYPADRVDFAARQLPGPCGDGHGRLGFTGLMPGPDGGGWDLLVPAGADGLMALARDGTWVRGVYGTPASLGFEPVDLDLLPEGIAIGFGAVLLILLFGVLDFRRDSTRFLVSAAGWAATIIVWWAVQRTGTRSLPALVGYSAIPFGAMAVGCRVMRCDVAEVFLGGFLGGAVGAGIVAIGSSHDSTSWGITLAAIAGIVTVFSGFGVRGQLRRPSISPIRLLTVGSVAVVAALVAFQPFSLWADGVIAGKHTADALAASTGAVGMLLAWRLASSFERRASRGGAGGPE